MKSTSALLLPSALLLLVVACTHAQKQTTTTSSLPPQGVQPTEELLPHKSLSVSHQHQSQKTRMLDRIIAIVEDGVILQSDLDRAVSTVKKQYAARPDQLPPPKLLQQQVLRHLILTKLQLERAKNQGIQVSSQEVDRAERIVAQKNHMTLDQLIAAVQRLGQNHKAFRQQLHDQLMVQKLRRQVVQSSVSVTDSEVNNLLNNPGYKATEVHLAHIDISLPSGANAADIQTAAAKAKAAIDAIHGGMDFKAAAARYSSAPDALSGGNLGWRHINAIPAAFVNTLSHMKVGNISPVLRGPTGFHIIKLIAKRKPPRHIVTQFHALHILIKPNDLLSMQQAHKKALSLYDRIVHQHASFTALAKEYSDDDTTANDGGDMGWFQPDAWGQAIGQKIVQLKDGGVSQPFQTTEGWHLLKRLGTRRRDFTEEIARNEARQAIGKRKAEQAYNSYLRDLRSSAYVKILVRTLAAGRTS